MRDAIKKSDGKPLESLTFPVDNSQNLNKILDVSVTSQTENKVAVQSTFRGPVIDQESVDSLL